MNRDRASLAALAADLVQAVLEREDPAAERAFNLFVGAMGTAGPDELTAAAAVLAPLLARVRLSRGGHIAGLVGGLIDAGADPGTALEILAARIADGLESAATFPRLWTDATGDEHPPDSELEARVAEVLARFHEPAQRGAVEAWYTVGEWIPALLVPLQRKHLRQAIPYRSRMVAAGRVTEDYISPSHWLLGLLLVLDDEPAIVLHRPTGRGYRITFGGIGDNFQLHTLLAASLIGDPALGRLAGTPPLPNWVAAATDGDPQSGAIHGQFNLVDAYGEWIWNEGRPCDIPTQDGVRVIVLDPPPYHRSWNLGRAYPLMRPTLTVDAVLSAAEAAELLAKVAQDKRSS